MSLSFPLARLNNSVLLVALFISGASSLVLETLWFEWLALHWGRTAEASAAVLATFMAGLGIGQWLMLARQRLPLSSGKLWGICEALVGILALAANWRFSSTQNMIGVEAIFWMLPPTLVMGMTLPLAVDCIRAQSLSSKFGAAYAVNTAGAALGAIAAAWWFIPQFGLSNTGFTAVIGQGFAALIVFVAATAYTTKPSHTTPNNTTIQQYPALLAVSASGLFILGMEVIWFRALLLTHRSTSENFAVMLATVLVAIAVASALYSYLVKTRPALSSAKAIAVLLVSQSALALITLWLWQPGGSGPIIFHSLCLIALPCGASAALMLAVSRSLASDRNRQAAAKLIFASTMGSAIGAPLVALWLIPQWGIATAFHILIAITFLAALINQPKYALFGFLGIGAAALYFPNEWQQKQTRAAQLYLQLDDAQLLSQTDGKYQSVQLLESRFLGEPLSHRLVTDSYSMTSTAADSERYMRSFAWLPQAMRTDLQDVLLISYGLGTTAESLLAASATQSLTIADPSSAVLSASSQIPRQQPPLADPRTSVQLEDGRKVLKQSHEKFDLITGEPPPPRLAGMHALYSREYFQLMHQALKPQGWASYWLPVDQLTPASTKAIINAFCQSFSDCSLWSGSHYNWILLGSKNSVVDAKAIDKLWQEQSAPLKAAGFEAKAQLASTYIAGSTTLTAWSQQQAPLTDNWPQRIAPDWPTSSDILEYAELLDGAEQRYPSSAFAKTWHFDSAVLNTAWATQPILNGQFRPKQEAQRLQVIEQLLEQTPWSAPVLWALGADQHRIDIAQNKNGDVAALYRAVGLLAHRQHQQAATELEALAHIF
ncbi:MAG: hypothetical protein OXT49_06175, partial [Gammaproteobacteria bacterium]|nr:hypothetical protein [Gammaproteobacteria bacterium]